MRCYLNNFVDNGAKGFVYNGPRSIQNDSDCSGSYYPSYVWYGELKNEIIARAISTNVSSSDEEILMENENPNYEEESNACFNTCRESGGTIDGCNMQC